MNTQTKTQQSPATQKTVKQWLSGDYFRQQVALALPKHLTPDRFVRVALTALIKTPKLQQCTPESVIQCLLNCSALGLEPDGRRAHLIPYGNTCTMIVDYKGIVELAKRSGEVTSVFAQIVCENDKFGWANGKVDHFIDWKTERGEMYAAYATITFKDGSQQTDVMTKHEIDAVRRRSKASGSGPWVTDYNEMAKKTVFRRASKWITLSPEIADALENEDAQPSSEMLKTVDLASSAPEEDDIPMGDSAPIEVVSEVAKEPKELTPQKQIEKLCSDRGISFDHLQIWGESTGNIENASSLSSFDDIQTETATRLLKAQKGLISALLSIKGDAK